MGKNTPYLVSILAGIFVTCALLACSPSLSAQKQLPGVDNELARALSSGQSAFSLGLTEQAVFSYRQALLRARAMDDASAISNAAYNLAVSLIVLRRYEEAKMYLSEAKREVSSKQGNISDILLVEAKVAYLQGRSNEALALTDEIIKHSALTSQTFLLQAHVLRGHIACDSEDASITSSEIRKAIQYAANVDDPAIAAELAGLRGRAYLIEKEFSKAAMQFDNEAALLRKAKKYGDMVRAFEKGGNAYISAGKNETAADRFYSAARSALGQGNTGLAAKFIRKAINMAELTASPKNLARYQELLAEIENGIAKD